MDRVFKANLASLVVIQGVTFLSPLILLPYLSRQLEPELFGLYLVILTLINLALLVMDFGFNLYGTQVVAKFRVDEKEKDVIFLYNVYCLKAIIGLLIFVTLYFYLKVNFASNIDSFTALIVCAGAVIQGLLPNWYFYGKERSKLVLAYIACSKFVFMIGTIALVNGSDDFSLIFVSFLCGNILSALIAIRFLFNNVSLGGKGSIAGILGIVKAVFPYFLSRAALTIYATIGTLIVSQWAGLFQAALFSSVEKIYVTGQAVLSPISQALLPRLSKTKDLRILYSFIKVLLPIIVIVSASTMYFSESIIELIFGESYLQASSILIIFMVTLLINFVSTCFGYPAFSALERTDVVNKSIYIGALVQLVQISWLIANSNVTAINIAFSILVTELLIASYRFIYFSRLKP